MARTKTPADEIVIAASLQAIADGISVREAAKEFNIPRSTLQARLKNGNTRPEKAYQQMQRLSVDQETGLANWIMEEEANGHNPTHAELRQMAHAILQASGDCVPLGKQCVHQFRRRNLRLKNKHTRAPAVAAADTPDDSVAVAKVLAHVSIPNARTTPASSSTPPAAATPSTPTRRKRACTGTLDDTQPKRPLLRTPKHARDVASFENAVVYGNSPERQACLEKFAKSLAEKTVEIAKLGMSTPERRRYR